MSIANRRGVNRKFLSGIFAAPSPKARPWPPRMIRDLGLKFPKRTIQTDTSIAIGYIVDFLASSPDAVVTVKDQLGRFLGIAVDDDVMALFKRDGNKALEYPIIEAVQRDRPVYSITDSPHLALEQLMQEGWDRIGIRERGEIIGVLHRHELTKFIEA